LLSILGLLAIPYLEIRLNPSKSLPSIDVNYFWTGATANSVDRNMTSIIEGGLKTIQGVKNITAKSSRSSGRITIEFDKKKDIDKARFEVANIIRQVKGDLPETASYPIISSNRPNDEKRSIIQSYSITGSDISQVESILNSRVLPDIRQIIGVDQTVLRGLQQEELEILLKDELMAVYGITIQDVLRLFNDFNTSQTVASVVHESELRTIVKASSTFMDFKIPIKNADGRIIYLNDIAEFRVSSKEKTGYFRINGVDAITVSIYPKNNINILELGKVIEQHIVLLNSQIGSSVSIFKTYDSTTFLNEEIKNLIKRTLYTIGILSLLLLIFSRSYKIVGVLLISVFANLTIAFLCYYLFEIELQIYSLAGVTISLGLIIDNSIILIDHLRKRGNIAIAIPIFASTLTTSGALSVIYFLDDALKVNLIDFALVIIINLAISILVSLFLVPKLLQNWTQESTSSPSKANDRNERWYGSYESLITLLVKRKKWLFVLVIFLFGIPIFLLPTQLEDNGKWFNKAYNNTLGSQKFVSDIKPPLEKYLGGTLRLFSNNVLNKASYKNKEESKLVISAAMGSENTVDQLNQVFILLEKYLNGFDHIKQHITIISEANYGQIEVFFKDNHSASFPYLLKSQMIKKSTEFSGLDWSIYGVGKAFNDINVSNETSNISITAKGYEYDKLKQLAELFKMKVSVNNRITDALIKGNTFRIEKARFNYFMDINEANLSIYNLSIEQIYNKFLALGNSNNSDINVHFKEKYLPVKFRSIHSRDVDIWSLKNENIDSLQRPVSIQNFSTLKKRRIENDIYRENQEYVLRVNFQYLGNYANGVKLADDLLAEFQSKLPIGYSFTRENSIQRNGSNTFRYISYLGLIILLIYMVCAMLFESFTLPLGIICVIPVSFIGVFLTFYLFDFRFDQGGLASFILLSGLTVNAAIFILWSYKKRLISPTLSASKTQLYVQAFREKIAPILMATISTILGFIPFLFGGENDVFWFSLAVGTIGGLVFSILAVVFLLPLVVLKRS